jgi:limonene-1,2-epoxide hydrolase
VLAVLSESYTKRQVPLDSVKQNPFILPGEGEAPTIAPVAGESPDEAMARARTLRQKDIDAAVSKLAVKSIIMGSQPLANISGTIVRVGDELAPEGTDVTFRVGAIAADGITLVAEDLALGMHVEVPLSMHQNK